MYRISPLMSKPVASKCSSVPEREHSEALFPTCLFPSFACDSLDVESSFDCCSIDPLTGSHLPCRRSPRLLTNGYYIWTQDSFFCDSDGNITLSPSQTSVIYKENSVRIFRRKRRLRHSFSSLFDLGASKSWLHESIFGGIDSSPGEDSWLEGVGGLDTHHYNKNGGDFDSSQTDDWEAGNLSPEFARVSSSGLVIAETPRKKTHNSSLQFQLRTSERLQGNILDHSKTSLLGDIVFQTILLAACLIISVCARWFVGGVLSSVFVCSLMVTMAYVVKLLFLSLASYFKATPCVRLAGI